MTIIEGARVSTARVFAQRALSTSMDSILAEFYGPLWEEYHILGYDKGEGSTKDQSLAMSHKLAEYMSFTFQPNQGMGRDKKGLELYSIAPLSITVSEQTELMDYKGELFINEAAEYMKYKEVADGVKSLLNKLSLLEEPQKVSVIYEKKIAAEDELAKVEKNTLRLMELLDGIPTSEKGIELDREGRLQGAEYFVKMICMNTPSAETVGINNNAVFLAVQNRFINPAGKMDQSKNDLLQLNQLAGSLASLNNQLAPIFNQISQLQSRISSLSQLEDRSEAAEEELQKANEDLKALMQEQGWLQGEISVQTALKERLNSSVTAFLEELQKVPDKLLPLITEAKRVIQHSMTTMDQAKAVLLDYEATLEQNKDGLSEDILAELTESLKRIKQYNSSSTKGNGYAQMLQLLEKDEQLLQTLKEQIEEFSMCFNGEAYLEAGKYLDQAAYTLNNYQIKELQLDYSSLVLDHTKGSNPVEELGKQLELGLTGLIVDSALISKQILSRTQLPSALAALKEESSTSANLLREFIDNFAKGNNTTGIQGLFQYFNDFPKLKDALGNSVNIIGKQLLFQEYLKTHFETYPSQGEDSSGRKPSALVYELEYILAGQQKDADNLSSMIARIIFIRMIMDFVSILGNKTCQEQALAVANAMVGFTGLPALISITKTALLLLWAFSEALLDTCGLLMGKELPLIKNKIILTFPELFLINHDFLKNKAEQLVTSGPSLSYRDYLRLFMLLTPQDKLAFRSMDLIQENINLRYEDAFLLQNCLYGFRVEAEFISEARFLTVPFMQKDKKHKVKGFRFSSIAEHSY